MKKILIYSLLFWFVHAFLRAIYCKLTGGVGLESAFLDGAIWFAYMWVLPVLCFFYFLKAINAEEAPLVLELILCLLLTFSIIIFEDIFFKQDIAMFYATATLEDIGFRFMCLFIWYAFVFSLIYRIFAEKDLDELLSEVERYKLVEKGQGR